MRSHHSSVVTPLPTHGRNLSPARTAACHVGNLPPAATAASHEALENLSILPRGGTPSHHKQKTAAMAATREVDYLGMWCWEEKTGHLFHTCFVLK